MARETAKPSANHSRGTASKSGQHFTTSATSGDMTNGLLLSETSRYVNLAVSNSIGLNSRSRGRRPDPRCISSPIGVFRTWGEPGTSRRTRRNNRKLRPKNRHLWNFPQEATTRFLREGREYRALLTCLGLSIHAKSSISAIQSGKVDPQALN